VNGDSVILFMAFLSPGNAAFKSYDAVLLADLVIWKQQLIVLYDLFYNTVCDMLTLG
jgi:hypothetical protein